MKLSRWIHASVKPIREGDYQVRFGTFMEPDIRTFKSGVWWFEGVAGRNGAESEFGVKPLYPEECWRGLAHKPKAKK